MIDYKQEIQNILFDNPQHFLMSDGGEGMDFLSTTISKYSNTYSTNNSYTTDKNRSHVKLPWFYHIFSNMITLNTSTDKMITDLHNLLIEHGQYVNTENNFALSRNPETIDECINNVKLYHTSLGNMPLIKTHFSNSDYFNKTNTFFIFPNEYKWFEYKWRMWYTKVWTTDLYKADFDWVFHTRKTMFLLEGESVSAYDRLLAMVKDKQLEFLSEGYVAYLDFADPNIDLDGYLDIPISELYSRVLVDLPERYAKWVNRITEMGTLNKLNIIEYDKIFQKGYLENMFNITSDSFHDELLNWHNKNLALMTKYDLDTDQYKI